MVFAKRMIFRIFLKNKEFQKNTKVYFYGFFCSKISHLVPCFSHLVPFNWSLLIFEVPRWRPFQIFYQIQIFSSVLPKKFFYFKNPKKVKVMTWLLGDLTWLFLKKWLSEQVWLNARHLTSNVQCSVGLWFARVLGFVLRTA